jgi:formylglycine-generating enzyme required for sulfatase activity
VPIPLSSSTAGGGTIDWAWLRRDGESFALATECPPGGDRNVGGHDVDLELLQLLLEQLDDTDAEQVESQRLHYLHELRALKERYSRGLPLTPIRVSGTGIELGEDQVQAALSQRFVDHAVEGLRSYLDQVREQTKGAAPPVLLVGGSARIKGLKEAIEKECECRTLSWERSEYATVLGALPAAPSPKSAPLPAPSPKSTPPELPVPQDIHGWSTEQVQALQRQTAEALGKPVAFRDRLKGSGEGPEMLIIPPGKFLMGSPTSEPERDNVEGPQHAVTLTRPFALARYAVSVGEFARFVEAVHYRTEAEKDGGIDVCVSFQQDERINWRTPGFEQTDKHPVTCVSWNDAQAYCQWLCEQTGAQYRLPSEAQWEYACRAGTTTPFWWGDGIDRQQANNDGSRAYHNGPEGKYLEKTLPVDQFAPNPWDLYRMHGNVWEWVQDRFAGYSNEPQEDPIYAERGSGRVFRGGSWFSSARSLRAACRGGRYEPDSSSRNNLGFRPARIL